MKSFLQCNGITAKEFVANIAKLASRYGEASMTMVLLIAIIAAVVCADVLYRIFLFTR